MTIENILYERSESKCELCKATDNLNVYKVQPNNTDDINAYALICNICKKQIENKEMIIPQHWLCLKQSMWSQFPAVQVLVWRMLQNLKSESWSTSLLDMLYLDEETLGLAQASNENTNINTEKHLDSNGVELQSGDTITIIKDLKVKGANFTAKRGTSVKSISLVQDNPEQIEGRVSGQKIVILTKFVSKS
tara:strand:- start:3728 stop:4303 length:576 start_codon:yes stop_codon:yes gene_type:complete